MVWQSSPDQLQHLLGRAGVKGHDTIIRAIRSNRRKLEEEATRALATFARQHVSLVFETDEAFPQRLREIKSPPRWLFVQGDVATISVPNLIAVVGTRNASAEGIKRSRVLSQWLGEHGFGLVAGLAEGIDQAVHQTAVDLGIPTVAVLGTGIDVVFPAGTGHTRAQIIGGSGCVVSEYLPSESYSRARFIRRNRIQAGLSFATVPIEAEESSGTAHTYRFAKEYGRVVFGVTNRNSPHSNGILRLLKNDEAPIFDLDSKSSMAHLLELLTPAFEGAPVRRFRSSPFESVQREFERILDSYSVDDEDFKDLLSALKREWEEQGLGRKGSNT